MLSSPKQVFSMSRVEIALEKSLRVQFGNSEHEPELTSKIKVQV